jgi:hypothetical protein
VLFCSKLLVFAKLLPKTAMLETPIRLLVKHVFRTVTGPKDSIRKLFVLAYRIDGFS